MEPARAHGAHAGREAGYIYCHVAAGVRAVPDLAATVGSPALGAPTDRQGARVGQVRVDSVRAGGQAGHIHWHVAVRVRTVPQLAASVGSPALGAIACRYRACLVPLR